MYQNRPPSRARRNRRRAALTATGLLAIAAPSAAMAAGFSGATVPKQTDKVSHGVAPVKVKCPSGTVKSCDGTLALRTAKKINGKTQSLGSARFSIAPGHTSTVKVKLNAEGRKLVKTGKVTPIATAFSRDGSNHTAKHSTKITLKTSNGPVYGGY